MSWAERAACLGAPEAWFFGMGKTHRAKAVCAGCPVQTECLVDELDLGRRGTVSVGAGHDLGVRGGATAKERKAYLDAALGFAP